MSECEACGQEKHEVKTLSDAFEIAVNEGSKVAKDEMVYGVSCRCTECKRRVDPREKIADIEEKRTVKEMFRDEQTDETKFLEEESLTHGME